MAMIKCLECRGEISDQAEKCPHCGAKRQKTQSPTSFVLSLAVGAVLAYFAFKFFSGGA
jgi:Zn finger protein HypA/HybF involved in hydrogenase expression